MRVETTSISFVSGLALFCKNHPGILLVIIGVAGEIVCEWDKEKGTRGRLIRLFGLLLVIGLLLEIWEAVKADEQVAHLTQTNLVLQSNVLVLKTAFAVVEKDAALAKQSAEESKGQTALVKYELEKTRQALDESISRSKTPRIFRDMDGASMRLARFAGVSAVITSVDDGDARDVLRQIEIVLSHAGWNVKTNMPPERFGPPQPPPSFSRLEGVIVETRAADGAVGNNPLWKTQTNAVAAGRAINSELNNSTISAMDSMDMGDSFDRLRQFNLGSPERGVVYIRVGFKP
jgi:hypothetical protein